MQPDEQWRQQQPGGQPLTPPPGAGGYGGQYGAAPSYPTPPPGMYPQQPSYDTQYQQYAYGYNPTNFGPPGNPYAGWQPRPSGATVITAAVIQIVQGALGVLVGLLVAFVADAFDNAAEGAGIGDETDAITGAIAAIGIGIVLFSVFLIVLGALAIRRQRWAALTSVVLQSIGVLLAIIGLASDSDTPGATVVSILLSGAVITLFLVPQSNRYFSAP